MRNHFSSIQDVWNYINFYKWKKDRCLSAKVCKLYTEEHQSLYYHNLDHVLKVCNFISHNRHAVNKIDNLEQALFHDFIYAPLLKDNEEHSFYAFCRYRKLLSLPKPDSNDYAAIIATKHLDPKKYNNIQLYHFGDLLDADLSILIGSRKSYSQYYKNLKTEYLDCGVRELDFEKGRINFLNSMLKKSRIFCNLHFGYDSKAKENIKEELYYLSTCKWCKEYGNPHWIDSVELQEQVDKGNSNYLELLYVVDAELK